MSEKKTELDEEYDEEQEEEPDRGSSSSPCELPEHQYSKEKLIAISEHDVSRQRPECLDKAYDTKDGKWDPERWWYASREDSPLTVDGKERRKIIDIDRDPKRKLSVNDPVERLKEERDGIVLSPQRRSFGTGCHVQQSVPYMRQSSLTERDRDEGRVDRDRERERDRDRDRAAPRKIGSGRIAIDRDGGRDFSNLRDRERERDIPWGRERLDRDRDRDWDRERDRDDWDRDRDRRFDRDRSDRFRRDSDRDYRDRRDYRPYDRSGRRRNFSEDEKEPEWFTGGPTSQNDTIELRGFESENQKHPNGLRLKKAGMDHETERIEYRGKIESVSESDLEGTADKQCKEDEVFADSGTTRPQEMESELKQPKLADPRSVLPQDLHPTDAVATPNFFDLDEFLKSNLPLSEDSETQGSRFSRFFRGSSGNAPTPVSEHMLMPKDLLDDNRSSPFVPSPSHHPAMMNMKAPPGFYSAHMEQDSSIKEISTALPYSSGSIPNSAGDNNATSKAGLPPSVTALFNRAVPAGSNASLSSNSSFSTQDAEAQLKAMLFGGPRDSASSSGTASPAGVPPNFQKRVKTVAELEADMIQNSPKKTDSPVHVPMSAQPGAADSRKDMTAFNNFLIMINAASEANQNSQTRKDVAPNPSGVQGMIPSHSEFTQAVMRNKEHQMELLQQSMNLPPGSPMQGALPHPSSDYASHPHLSSHAATNFPPHAMGPVVTGQQQRTAVHAGFAGLTPQSTSTPQVPMNPNASKHHSHPSAASNPSSSDPIFNLIQQNPTIVMKPASPAPGMAAIIASQASGMPASARVPSPIMFGQQPPLHLNAPSPIHPSQLSPTSLNSPSRSPVLKRGISPQELAVHAQAVMQSALLKKQLQNQSERYIKKQQERAKSPIRQVVKPQPAAQPIMPPNPQPKGSTVNTFTPTSVMVKMHSDKAMEKEKQAQEIGDRKPMEYMPSMEELSSLRSEGNPAMVHNARDGDMNHGKNISVDVLNNDGGFHGGRGGCPPAPPDASDISFLDPINPSLVALENQIDSLRINSGQINILPGGLSQPMSVEEKMKLSSLVEKPGYLSQILDAKAAQAESAKIAAKMGRRPIVRAVDQPMPEEMMLQNQPPPPGQPQPLHVHVQVPLNQQQQQQVLQQQGLSMGRPVMGSGGMKGPTPMPMHNSSVPAPMVQTSSPVFQNAGGMVSVTATNKSGLGRAIVGSAPSTAHPPPSMGTPVLHPEMMRHYEQQKQQQLQQHLQQQSHAAQAGIVIPPPPPPPGAIPYMAAAPPHLGLHRVPIHPSNHALMQQHMARANAMNAARAPHLMALHHPGQSPGRPMASMPGGVPSGPISPQGHQAMGSLSASALSATIQQVSSPHKMNGPMVPPSSGVNGRGHPMEMSGGNVGIQRWFSSDILKTQLPSMPPLPTHSGQVMTVDELERI